MEKIHPLYLHKNEDLEAYKRFAEKGMDLMYPVKLKGKTHRPDINIPYHTTIKLFDTSKDKPEQAHEVAQRLDLIPPDPKAVQIEATTLKGRTGYTMHVIKLLGPHAKRIEDDHKFFSRLGFQEAYEFHPHITVDEQAWNEIVNSKAKTAHEAGIEFLPATLMHEDKQVATYKPKQAIKPGGDPQKEDKLRKTEEGLRKAEGMKITPGEIESVQEAGMLDGTPVKMIRTKGGFWIAVGKPKGKMREEAISAGSHPAIVKYNLEKTYPSFQPAMMKSEFFSDNAIVAKHSHHLSETLQKSGHDVYSVQEGDSVNFHITKHNVKVASVDALLEEDFLIIRKLEIPKEFAGAMARATLEKAMSAKAGLKLRK